MVLNLIPPIPYTPKLYSRCAEADRVQVWYAAGHEKHEAFNAGVEALSLGASRYELERGLADAQKQRAFYESQPEGPQRSRALARLDAQMDETALVLASPTYADVTPLDRDGQHDTYATILGLVVVYVKQGDVTMMFPSDHAKRVDFVRGLPPMALIDLVRGIRSQLYDETEAGN